LNYQFLVTQPQSSCHSAR